MVKRAHRWGARRAAKNPTGRVEAFSDGVFASAITLLALDIHVPRVEHGSLAAPGRQWPTYLAYVTSLLMIHRLYD